MSDLNHVHSYKDLVVYRKARLISKQIFDLSKSFPAEERYSLTDQVRRSSRSVGAQIAEAWAKRRYEKHFVSKLTDADGEQLETQHWIETAQDCRHLTKEQASAVVSDLSEIGRMLGSMIQKSNSFCKTTTLRETSPQYEVPTTTDH